MPIDTTSTLAIIIGASVAFLFFLVFLKPLRKCVKFLLNSAVGVALLFVLHALGGTLPISAMTLLGSALLGLPGIALLLLLRLIFHV
ncbi:pro-sigmaK processing inhibitor BofA family protein [Feifania hominis]|uniref:Pro-sigmaK processing inhibitor BofA family protein n=1 Tax=Feifania hominis TaxID=2763660 RepID=A0A926DF95_9FIRM|nr:pro-sigmaK processing inhibitor BofA family protein [Feifania hominis]MBC8537073.1 pro-sigmaK processing inhibitor BofA family protein [Feifania hominis]